MLPLVYWYTKGFLTYIDNVFIILIIYLHCLLNWKHKSRWFAAELNPFTCKLIINPRDSFKYLNNACCLLCKLFKGCYCTQRFFNTNNSMTSTWNKSLLKIYRTKLMNKWSTSPPASVWQTLCRGNILIWHKIIFSYNHPLHCIATNMNTRLQICLYPARLARYSFPLAVALRDISILLKRDTISWCLSFSSSLLYGKWSDLSPMNTGNDV